jgi:hypothetical protein
MDPTPGKDVAIIEHESILKIVAIIIVKVKAIIQIIGHGHKNALVLGNTAPGPESKRHFPAKSGT